MTYESDIPEYALQPAKAPKVIDAEAIYNTSKIIYPAEEQTISYQFEEDILVPDIKPDMREILLMDAEAEIMPAEKKILPKADDLLGITGTLTIQTLYNGQTPSGEPVAITSKVPYKYQWSLNPAEPAEGVFSCTVKNLEYMIVNERKFRVKITLEFRGKLFCEREFAFFSGLQKESLELKHKAVEMTCLQLVKKDEVTIDETFKPRESAYRPTHILKQDFVVTENYRQVTTEKVVINGFVYCSLLYQGVPWENTDEDYEGSNGEAAAQMIAQHNQRIEFTQFVPLDKDHRGKNKNTVKTYFDGKNLSVEIDHDEEGSEDVFFRIKGDIRTRVELYEALQQDMIVDAYHREKNFTCDFSKKKIAGISDNLVTETSVREIVNLPEEAKATGVFYCNGKILDCKCICEGNKISFVGVLSVVALWKDSRGASMAKQVTTDFRGTVDAEGILPESKVSCHPVIKTAVAELINEKQLEINLSILISAQVCEEAQLVLLENPRFVDKPQAKEYPMVVVKVKAGECLWDLAKRYRTTENNIRLANHLESEPEVGQKLLVVK